MADGFRDRASSRVVVVIVLWVGSAALTYAAIRDMFIVHREAAWTSAVLALVFISLAMARTWAHFHSTKGGSQS
jgi:hypothetical protein